MGRPATSLQMLFKRTKVVGGCRIWLGALSRDGRYGCCSYKDKTTRVHRLVYQLTKGDLPEGALVRHSCDTPLCVEPLHLLLGSDADNMADKVERGRQAVGEGCNHPHRVLTDELVVEMRLRRSQGEEFKSLAKRFGCSRHTAMNVCSRKSWRHVL